MVRPEQAAQRPALFIFVSAFSARPCGHKGGPYVPRIPVRTAAAAADRRRPGGVWPLAGPGPRPGPGHPAAGCDPGGRRHHRLRRPAAGGPALGAVYRLAVVAARLYLAHGLPRRRAAQRPGLSAGFAGRGGGGAGGHGRAGVLSPHRLCHRRRQLLRQTEPAVQQLCHQRVLRGQQPAGKPAHGGLQDVHEPFSSVCRTCFCPATSIPSWSATA